MTFSIDPFSNWLANHTVRNSIEEGRGPILLMYHGTCSEINESSSSYSTSARQFADHITFLRNYGWHTACVRDLANPESLPEKTVILTFDDGYANNFEGAFIPLAKFNMHASWFITTGVIDHYAGWLGKQSPDSKIMSASQIREMHDYGMEIGSHTHTHPDLSTLPYSKQLTELNMSKEELESIIDQNVSSFAYPFGRYNQMSIQAANECKYRHACTVKPGWAGSDTDPFQLRRVTIFVHDNVRTLARKLVFADNDVSWPRIGKYYWTRLQSRLTN